MTEGSRFPAEGTEKESVLPLSVKMNVGGTTAVMVMVSFVTVVRATFVRSISAGAEVVVLTLACSLLAVEPAVVKVLVPAKLKQYVFVESAKLLDGNVTTLAGVVALVAVPMPGQANVPTGISVVATVQLAAVEFTV
jgi:hypothetical protein